MKRLLLAGVVCAAGTVVLGGVGVGTNILRSPEELDSLRTLVNDAGAWEVLDRLAGKYAIWAVATEPDPASGDPAVRLHHFDFGHREGRSSKLYRLTFRSTATGADGYHIAVQSGRFLRGASPPRPATLARARELVVLRSLLNDETVVLEGAGASEREGAYNVLARCLETHAVQSVRIVLEDAEEEGEPEMTYAVIVTAVAPGKPVTTLRFRTLYEVATRSVGEFELLEG